MYYQRTGVCSNCGQCCGSNGLQPTNAGVETINKWSLDDVSESFNLWMLFGLGWNPQTETIEPESPTFSYKVKGKTYTGVWFNNGRWTVPQKSPTNVECPFLMDDPGDGTRPCALVGSQDEGARTKFCRPEENPEYVPERDIHSQRSMERWVMQHPLCTYMFIERPDIPEL